jgi:hypothetical protein
MTNNPEYLDSRQAALRLGCTVLALHQRAHRRGMVASLTMYGHRFWTPADLAELAAKKGGRKRKETLTDSPINGNL